MSGPYVDSDTWTDVVTLFDDGDERKAAAANVPNEALLDRTRYLYNRVVTSSGYIERYIQPAVELNHNSRWTYAPGGVPDGLWNWIQTDVTDGGRLAFPITLPIVGPGWQLQEVKALIHGGQVDGHTSWPVTYPHFTLWRVTSSGVAAVDGAGGTSVYDAPASQGAYEDTHEFGFTGLTEQLIPSRWYYGQLYGESGGNAEISELAFGAIYLKIAPL